MAILSKFNNILLLEKIYVYTKKNKNKTKAKELQFDCRRQYFDPKME